MRQKEGLQLRQVGRRYMIVDVRSDKVNMSDVFSLNETAADLWKRMGEGDFTVEELAAWLCDTYEVEPKTALKDVTSQLEEWKKYGLVE